jgi:hypothetical protein
VGDDDPTLTRIGRGAELGRSGERQGARDLLAQVWREVGEDGDPLHRCALAHAMADVQDDVAEELAWDLRALDAASALTAARVEQAGVAVSPEGLLPSLHLNAADCYRRLGRPGPAREHLQRGRAAVGALGDDGYARMVVGGLDRLAERLGEARP